MVSARFFPYSEAFFQHFKMFFLEADLPKHGTKLPFQGWKSKDESAKRIEPWKRLTGIIGNVRNS
jgi:hypothetical protein